MTRQCFYFADSITSCMILWTIAPTAIGLLMLPDGGNEATPRNRSVKIACLLHVSAFVTVVVEMSLSGLTISMPRSPSIIQQSPSSIASTETVSLILTKLDALFDNSMQKLIDILSICISFPLSLKIQNFFLDKKSHHTPQHLTIAVSSS